MTTETKTNNNEKVLIQVSENFRIWLQRIKVHKNQGNWEICDTIMQVCKQKGVLEGE